MAKEKFNVKPETKEWLNETFIIPKSGVIEYLKEYNSKVTFHFNNAFLEKKKILNEQAQKSRLKSVCVGQ